MAYNSLIPQPNDLLSQSQSEIQQNFAEIQTLIGINHINFGAAGAGKHLYLQLPETAAPTTAVNEAGLYANVGATSAVTELFFRRENNGTSIPMTEGVAAASGWTYLPSGILLQWAPFTISSSAGLTVTFPRAFASACFGVFVQEITAGGSTHNWFQVISGTLTTTQARITSKDGNGNASTSQGIYCAIGN